MAIDGRTNQAWKITNLWKRRGGTQFRQGKGVNGSLVPTPSHTVNLAQEVILQQKVARVLFFFRSWRPGCPCSRRKRRACSASRVSCKNSETPSGRSFPSRGAASRYGSLFLKPRVTTMMMVMKTMVMWTMLLQPLRKIFNFSPVAPSSPSPLVIDLPIRKV